MISQLALARLGMTWTTIDPSWVGVVRDYEFVGPNLTGGLVRDNEGKNPTCKGVIVQNKTGGTIVTGALVTLNGTSWPSQINDECATAEVAFGVVDPFIAPFGAAGASGWSTPATVASDAYCIVIVAGPCLFRLPAASASVTALDYVLPHATEDGRIEPVDATPDNDAEAFFASLTCVGQVFETSAIENALVEGVFYGRHAAAF